MSNNYFKFKQFTVWQERTAMKVGTDGVLLGVLASAGESRLILDIGTGTGLIALILAQRFPLAHVDAVEVDENASAQAADNFLQSPFAERLTSIRADVSDYSPKRQYDLITCNPPYYSNSLVNPDKQKAIARHTLMLTYEELARSAARLLKGGGVLAVIVPANMFTVMQKACESAGLWLRNAVNIHSVPSKPAKRVVAHFVNSAACGEAVIQNLSIEDGNHAYSPDFEMLVRDFYLDKK